jgi:hypothetical protein
MLTGSSQSYDFSDSAQACRSRKKLGEKEAYKIVDSVRLEVWQQIESALSKLGGIARSNAEYDAFKYACDDIADANIHESSPEDIANQARRALQLGLARAVPGTVVQFPGMPGDSSPPSNLWLARICRPWLPCRQHDSIRQDYGLGGEDGTGKSRLLLQLAVGVCSTAVWAGLRTGPVIFYTVEETAHDMRSRLMKLARALGIDDRRGHRHRGETTAPPGYRESNRSAWCCSRLTLHSLAYRGGRHPSTPPSSLFCAIDSKNGHTRGLIVSGRVIGAM